MRVQSLAVSLANLGAAVLVLSTACTSEEPERRENRREVRAGRLSQALGSVPVDCTSATFGSEVYYFCGDGRSWIDARAKCLSTPGLDLVRIDSAAENAFVASNVMGESWLSANDRSTEGAWRWSVAGSDDGPQFWAGSSHGGPVGGLYSN